MNALEANKKQWGIGAEGGAAPAATPAPKAAAPKAKAAKKGAAPAAKSVGFSGVPGDFSRPEVNCPSGFPAADETQVASCLCFCCLGRCESLVLMSCGQHAHIQHVKMPDTSLSCV